MLLSLDRMGRGRFVLYTITLLVIVFLIIPIVFIPVLSLDSSRWLEFPPPGWTLRWYDELITTGGWIPAILNSLKIGFIVMVLALALGLPASFAVVRGRLFGKNTLNAFFTAPLIVPVIILAIALYALILRFGIGGTLFAFVASHLVIALPLTIICISSSLQTFDIALEKAAIICGASPLEAVFRITLPSIRFGIIAGGLFAFLTSWDEVVLAIFMATPMVQTLPVKIWVTLRGDMSPIIAAASSVLLLTTIVMMAIVAAFRRSH